jgi:hypothetical protein
MNRKNRRAATKKIQRQGDLVMFAIKAPPLGPGLAVIKTDLQAFSAVTWRGPGAHANNLSHQILSMDKDIIRAIYYPDEMLGIKATPELFTAALAESVTLWSQRLSSAQQPYFDRHGLHRLEISEVEHRLEWFWTFNTNNKMQVQSNRAWLSPVANLDMRHGPANYAPIDIGITGDEVVNGLPS